MELVIKIHLGDSDTTYEDGEPDPFAISEVLMRIVRPTILTRSIDSPVTYPIIGILGHTIGSIEIKESE